MRLDRANKIGLFGANSYPKYRKPLDLNENKLGYFISKQQSRSKIYVCVYVVQLKHPLNIIFHPLVRT